MREDFERWYLQVTRGSPSDLLKDENGQYKFVGREYLAWEAATLVERETCDKLMDEVGAKLQTEDKSNDYWMGVGAMVDAAELAIRERPNKI